MGRLFKKHPLTIYRVKTQDQASLLDKERSYDQLQRVKFETIDDCAIEKTFGTVTIENYRSPWFEPGNTEFAEYVAFSIRIDERKIPGAALNRLVEDAVDTELEQAKLEGRTFVSRDRKREIREQIKLRLLVRTVPTPTVADVWWNTPKGLIFLTDKSTAMKNAFEKTFVGAFGTQYELEELQLGHTEAGELIGHHFLTWLWNEGSFNFSFNGEKAIAFIDDKVHAADAQEVLKAEQLKGKDSGFDDIKRAVSEDGKMIIRALIRIEYQEHGYEVEVDSNLSPMLVISVPPVTHPDADGFDGALLCQVGNIEEAFSLFMKLMFYFELEAAKESPLAQAIKTGTERLDALQEHHHGRIDGAISLAQKVCEIHNLLDQNDITMTIETVSPTSSNDEEAA